MKKEATSNEEKNYPFFVGTYTNLESKGIYSYTLKHDGTFVSNGLAANSDNPSFLAQSNGGEFLLAVNEVDENGAGFVESFLIENDSLQLLSRSSSGGAHPCHVAINEAGDVLTANYTGGNLGLLKLDAKKKLSELLAVEQHEGSGGTERQEGPHAHFASFLPDKSGIVSVDLGTNELWFSKIDADSSRFLSSDPAKLEMPQGIGPRHLVFHPTKPWLYVINELRSSVSLIYRTVEGNYEIIDTITTLPDDHTEASFCADIHISPDGNFVYASNRGHNSIAIFKVDTQTGKLTNVGYESTRGAVPRNFALSPDGEFIVAANQHTNTLVSYRRNKEDGLLKFVAEIAAPNPVCILFR